MRGVRVATVAALAAVTAAGCGFKGAYSLPLPGGAAHGPTYSVTAIFDDVQDLTPRAAVRVNDVAVGDVTGITVGQDLKAHVSMKINSTVRLPANAVATLGQTTLLGEKFVALGPPGNGVAPRGRLTTGAVIEDGSTADLPDVEEVFGLLSNVLNGGDLGDLQTIDVELTKALSGREAAVRDVLSQLTTFVSALNSQKSQIVRALDQLDRLTTTLRHGNSTIATALTDLGPGLKVLADERAQFRGLLVNLSKFGHPGRQRQPGRHHRRVARSAADPRPPRRRGREPAARAGDPHHVPVPAQHRRGRPRRLHQPRGAARPRADHLHVADRPQAAQGPGRRRRPARWRDPAAQGRDGRAEDRAHAAAQRHPAGQVLLGRFGGDKAGRRWRAAATAPAADAATGPGPGPGSDAAAAAAAAAPDALRARRPARRPRSGREVISRTVKLQLVAFALMTLFGVTYVGASYVGINPLHRPFTVKVMLPSSGGIFTNAGVTERGVEVGKVGTLHIVKGGGVEVDLKLNNGVKIPRSNIHATVADLSAVGEQYMDLEPATATGPYLKSGDVIPESHTTIPVSDAVILRNLEQLLGSVNTNNLATVISQLGEGFDNLGPSLQQLIDNGNKLTNAALAAEPQTLTLINDGRTVLDTQRAVSGELKSFAHSFALLTGQLRSSDGSLRGVLDNGILASKQLKTLLSANAPVLPVLLNNLNTFTGIQAVRLPYVRTVLELYPAITADAFYALPPAQNGVSFARFGLVTDNGPFCSQGYSASVKRGNLASDWGGAADLSNFCTARSGVDERGAQHDQASQQDGANVTNADPYPGPKYPGPFPGSGQTSHGSSSSASGQSGQASGGQSPEPRIIAPFNPSTGTVIGPNGKRYLLGLNGPMAPTFGSNSYKWLLIAPTMR
jgi:phospholipid/cholesterol/gamma-HCH transport system substrate-binding protein